MYLYSVMTISRRRNHSAASAKKAESASASARIGAATESNQLLSYIAKALSSAAQRKRLSAGNLFGGAWRKAVSLAVSAA